MNFYISDLHLGHKNCLKFDSRPFKDLDEMHKVIVDNWNCVVSDEDTVYILGDIAWKTKVALEILPQLKGKKVLIRGNHDKNLNKEIEKFFVNIYDYLEAIDGDEKIILSHYPFAHWDKQEYGRIHLYGHIHEGRESRPFERYTKIMREELNNPYRCYNVGCMKSYMDYTPRTLKYFVDEVYVY